ncbi:MAG TPA: LLM class F420-dependent oxidoreductase [Candidatus Binataceae bacterium]|nr:LLM class F420-dependent oxidoreductase [Candidatus Binataceae bacterium]
MPKFGIAAVPTHESIQPAELARWTESNGFESLWFGEHSHIPTSRLSPSPLGGELPDFFKQFYDQFIALTVAASVTTKLKVGTGVCLVPEHHTINLAKAVACLDRVSNGRMLFGIGAGWNAEEMADHGVSFKDRWKVTREKVLAMRAIWTKDVAEYRGQFVNFDPLWCWPKPIQAGGPPVLLGAYSKWVPKRVAEYCDGWFPIDFPGIDLAGQLEGIKVEMERVGRPFSKLDLSIQVIAGAPVEKAIPRLSKLVKLGFERIVFLVPQTQPSVQRPALEGVARLIREFS